MYRPTSLLDRRVPQPGEYDQYGVPTDVQDAVGALYARRNSAPDAEVEPIDAEILRLLAPYVRQQC